MSTRKHNSRTRLIADRRCVPSDSARVLTHSFVILSALVVALSNWDCGRSGDVQRIRASIVNDVTNISALAWAYRYGGGHGSYRGLVIPLNMQTGAHALYGLEVLSPDTVRIWGKSTLDTENTVIVYKDANGNNFGWTYTGQFK